MTDPTSVSPSISYVTAADGCRIAVRTLRTGSKPVPPVVAIHALAMNGSMWSEVASFLSSDVTVLALDCRGHGSSDKPHGPYSTSCFAGDVLAVVDQFECSRVVLVGCSMGGTVALEFAGTYPERVEGLSVFDTTAWYGEGAAPRWEQRAQTALQQGMEALTAFQLERWFSPEFSSTRPDVVRKALDIFLANDIVAYAETCRMLGQADERIRVANYKGPALVSVGEYDYATPISMAEELARCLPQAKLSVIPHARHFTPFEVPKEVALRIDQVIRKIGD